MLDALTGGNGRIYIYHSGIVALDDWDYDDLVILWERGDSLQLALERLKSIRTDPSAKKKQKKPHHGRP
jgi:hypothetical protein